MLPAERDWAGLTAVKQWEQQTDPFARKDIYSAIKYEQEGSPHFWVQNRNGSENATSESWVCPVSGDTDLTAVFTSMSQQATASLLIHCSIIESSLGSCNPFAGGRKGHLGRIFVIFFNKILMEGKTEFIVAFKKPEWRVRCC